MGIAYRRLAGAIVLTGALGLTACGGSTATSDDVTSETSVAPLDRGSSEATTTAPSGSATSSSRAAASSNQPQDQGASEISSVPSAEPQVDPTEKAFLTTLTDGGVNVSGLEDQLVGTAQAVCANDPLSEATAGAVAGQLVEQKRTDKSVDEITKIIESSANDKYCQ